MDEKWGSRKDYVVRRLYGRGNLCLGDVKMIFRGILEEYWEDVRGMLGRY